MDFFYYRAGAEKVKSLCSILFSFTNKRPFSIIIAKCLMELLYALVGRSMYAYSRN